MWVAVVASVACCSAGRGRQRSPATLPFQARDLAATVGAPSLPALLPRLVATASSRALPPTSGYRVGAAGVGRSGRIYLGANLELPRAPLAQSVHAEQV